MPPSSARLGRGWRAGLLRFALRFLALFAAAVVIGALVVPLYSRVVASTSGFLFQLLERPQVTSVRSQDGVLWVDRQSETGSEPFNYFDPYLYGATPLVLALVLAVPRLRFWSGVRRAAAGLGLALLVQVLYVVGSVELAYVAVGLSPVGPLAHRALDWAQVLLRLAWEAAPLAIVLGLTWRDWQSWVAEGGDRQVAAGRGRVRKNVAAG